MKIDEINLKTSQELADLLLLLRKEFVQIVFENRVTRIANNSRFKLLRRDIARVLTVLNQRKEDFSNV